MTEKVEGKGLWLIAAMLAPMGQWLGSLPWQWVVGASLGAGVLFLLARRTAAERQGKLAAFLQLPFLLVAVGAAAAYTGACWLDAKVQWIFPVALLTLGACASSGSSAAARRAGSVMFWFVALGFGVLMAFALPDVRYLRAVPCDKMGMGLPVLLIPGILLLHPGKKGKRRYLLSVTAAAGLISLVTAGVLSPGVAANTPGAFLQMVRGIRVLGAAERLQALVAAVMTLSWFSLLSLILSTVGEMGEILWPGKRGVFVWGAAGAGAVMCFVAGEISAPVLAAGAIFFWYVLPAAEGLRQRRK